MLNPRSDRVAFMAHRVALGKVLIRLLRFSIVIIIPSELLSLIYHPGMNNGSIIGSSTSQSWSELIAKIKKKMQCHR